MPAHFLSFVGFLAWLSSSTFAFEVINFSEVHQCGPFNVSFSAGKLPVALPITLTVLPFDSPPLSVPIPNPSWDSATSTGSAVIFLPYVAGTTFIASLDDANGTGISPVTDIISILSSSDDSCVPTQTTTSTDRQYAIESTLIQCQPFDVSYNSSAAGPPSVRTFIPRGSSYFLNQTQDNGSSVAAPPYKIASYEMTAPQGSEVIMLFSDGAGYLESSNLTPVWGDVTSNTSCLSFLDTQKPMGSNLSTSGTSLSSKAVIGIAASICSVVVVAAVLMGVYGYFHYRHHKWNELQDAEGGPDIVYPKGLGPVPPSLAQITREKLFHSSVQPLYLNNPPYPVEKYTTSPSSPYFVQFPPASQIPQFEPYKVEKGGPYRTPSIRQSFVSITPQFRPPDVATSPTKGTRRQSTASSLDIDHMLELATMYSPDFDSNESKLLTPESPHTPHSPFVTTVAVRGNDRSTGQRERPQAIFPDSPTSNFENPMTTRGSRLRLQTNGSDDIPIDNAWDARSTYPGNSTFQFPARPEPAVIRSEDGTLAAGVGRGHSLGLGDL